MELLSERLALRPVSLDDLDFYVELRNHPKMLALSGGPRPRPEVERQLRRWLDRWQADGFGTWTVLGRTSEERLGRVEFDPVGPGWPDIPPDEVEVGCIVHPAHWSEGIATEATQTALADFFARVDRARVIALTTIDNRPALRALEKLGMRHHGQIQHDGDETVYEVFQLVRPTPPG